MSIDRATPLPEPRPGLVVGGFVLVGLIMFGLSLAGYPNFLDNERRLGGYVLDAVQNGDWLVPADATGDLVSKPPMLVWLAGFFALVSGGVSAFAMYAPTALATVGVSIVLYLAGRRLFNWRVGLLAGVAYLISPAGERLMVCSRYDGLLALPVLVGGLLAYRGWETGRGWTWFWLAAAFGTLVKGPLAILLSVTGLLAAVWEWRAGSAKPVRGNHWPGLVIFLVLCGGWFWAAYEASDGGIARKQLSRELIAHATGEGKNETPLMGFWEPPLNFTTHFLPWSLAAWVGMWRVFRRPSPDVRERRLERFLTCWILGGMLIFAVAAHQRGRLIFPLVPAAALLAARELDRWLAAWPARRLLRAAAGVAALGIVAVGLHHLWFLRYSMNVRQTLVAREAARYLRNELGDWFPVTHVDSPFAIQIWLNQLRPSLTMRRAAALFTNDAPVVLAITDEAGFRTAFPSNDVPVFHEVRRFVGPPRQTKSGIVFISNRGDRSWTNDIATLLGPVYLRLQNARLAGIRGGEVTVRVPAGAATITLSNTVAEPVTVKLRLLDEQTGAVRRQSERRLQANEGWMERWQPGA